MESIRKLGDVVNTALILGGAEAIIADRDIMLLDTSSWRRLGKVTFVQDGLCEEQGHNKGESCSRGI